MLKNELKIQKNILKLENKSLMDIVKRKEFSK